MISIDLTIQNTTQPISHGTREATPSRCLHVADKVKYCLRTSAFAIGGGICGVAGVFAYEWSRSSGSLSDDAPIWMALGGVVGLSCGNFLGLICNIRNS